MVWEEKNVTEERLRFIADWLKNEYTFSALCGRYNVSRKTGYKLINRYNEEGEKAIQSRSSAPMYCPHKIAQDVESLVLSCKYRYPTWGPVTIKAYLEREHTDICWPASSTIGELLKRYGLVKPKKRRKRVPPHSHPFNYCDSPNAVWSADYKGQFPLQNRKLCYPLTITDNYSRYLLGCVGLENTKNRGAKAVFERVFKEYGLPSAIRTDNGVPFASTAISGLSDLSVWWLKLGILPERIAPGHPEQNGRHERMHRTLKDSVPILHSLSEQNERFQKFIYEYNFERPHQGIGNSCPADLYESSLRQYPDRLEEPSYPSHFEVRKVRSNGEIKWKDKKIFLSELLYREPVGLEIIDEDRAQVFFCQLKLGIIDSRAKKLLRPDK